MKYVCHKVGVLFPLCESCETYAECEKEANKRLVTETQQEIAATA